MSYQKVMLVANFLARLARAWLMVKHPRKRKCNHKSDTGLPDSEVPN